MSASSNLEQWLDSQSARPDWPALAGLLLPAAKELAALHAAGTVHGSLALEQFKVIDPTGAPKLRLPPVAVAFRAHTEDDSPSRHNGTDSLIEADIHAWASIVYRIVIGCMPEPPQPGRSMLRSASHLGSDDYPHVLLALIDRSLDGNLSRRPSASDWIDVIAAGAVADPERLQGATPSVATTAGPNRSTPSATSGSMWPTSSARTSARNYAAASQPSLLPPLTVAAAASLAILAGGTWLVASIGLPPIDTGRALAPQATEGRTVANQTKVADPSATPAPPTAVPVAAPVATAEVVPPTSATVTTGLQTATPAAYSDTPRPVPAAEPPARPAPLWALSRDCPDCPELVVLQEGAVTFQLTPPDGRSAAKATFTVPRPFAIGQYEVTRGQFAAFIAATGYQIGGGCHRRSPEWRVDVSLSWTSPGFPQDDRHPVACISMQDAEAYLSWLSQRTNRIYRLPTDVEWHYAIDVGMRKRRPGDNQCERANGADATARKGQPDWRATDCDDGHTFTAPVGSFKPTRQGLYDLEGNLWEWVSDCLPRFDLGGFEYAPCPAEGQRIVRGGSWSDPPAMLTPDVRLLSPPGIRDQIVGFRVVRELINCELAPSGCSPASGSVPGSSADPGREAKVGRATSLTGVVRAVSPGGRDRTVTPGSDVYLDETVSTGAGGRATLYLGARTIVRLGESASVTLNEYLLDAGGEIEIGSGSIEFDRSGAQSTRPLNFRNAYGLISVRGTNFIAGTIAGRFGVLVEKGAVDVTSGGRTVLVEAGLGVDIERPGAPPSAPTPWSTARIEEAKASVR